ncbi:hypothetical protein JVU11DRAFT_10608 [Chiua virens]|nr:hypothetical protein JVU11DRAFT_10608 [Chiua virens]
MRVSRQWKLLKSLKWNGSGLDDSVPTEGDLTLFCPACPQPGINIPITDDVDFSNWRYTWTLVMDSIFKAKHMHTRAPEDDVRLIDGLGFMVK